MRSHCSASDRPNDSRDSIRPAMLLRPPATEDLRCTGILCPASSPPLSAIGEARRSIPVAEAAAVLLPARDSQCWLCSAWWERLHSQQLKRWVKCSGVSLITSWQDKAAAAQL